MYCGMVSSGHDIAVVPVSSHWQWLRKRPAKGQNSSTDREDNFLAPLFTEALLSVDSCWEKNHYSLMVWPLVGSPQSTILSTVDYQTERKVKNKKEYDMKLRDEVLEGYKECGEG